MRGVGGLKEQKVEREGRNKLSIFYFLKCVGGGGKVKVIATKPDSLSLIPRTHMVERTDCSKLSSDLNMHAVACTIHKKKTHKYNRKN